jgi:hypothetical protein
MKNKILIILLLVGFVLALYLINVNVNTDGFWRMTGLTVSEEEVAEQVEVQEKPEVVEEPPVEESAEELPIEGPVEELVEEINETVGTIEENNKTIEEISITETNVTEVNVTKKITDEIIIDEIIEVPENVTESNITEIENEIIITIQQQAVIGEPVKWVKKIDPEETGKTIVELPGPAENIKVKKIKTGKEEDITSEVNINGEEGNFLFNFILSFLRGGSITGRAVEEPGAENEKKEKVEVEIEVEDDVEYVIEYETEAPISSEEERGKGKRITISGPDDLHYENVLAYTELTEEAEQSSIRLYRTTNGTKELTKIITYDKNENGLVDYIEWNVESLSEQVYELVIEISDAEHLDENREFISDIYNEVFELDDIWSETIGEGEYVRVTFKQALTKERDITIYPRIISGDPRVEVYEVESSELIAEFTNLIDNEYNKVYLTNLQGQQDKFDLRIVDGEVEFDHIIDPVQEFFENCAAMQNQWTQTTWYTTGGECDTENSGVQEDETLQGSDFSLVGEDDVNISFYWRVANHDAAASEYIAMSISNDSGANWVEIWRFTALIANDNSFGIANVTLEDKITFTAAMALKVSCGGGNNENCFFDNINVTSYETVDTTAPTIDMVSPTNNTNTTNLNIPVNYTVADAAYCQWSNDSGVTNKSLTCGANVTGQVWDQGSNTVIIWANDTTGNENFTSITFTLDTTAPVLDIVYPTNNTNTTNINIPVNYTVSGATYSCELHCKRSNILPMEQ